MKPEGPEMGKKTSLLGACTAWVLSAHEGDHAEGKGGEASACEPEEGKMDKTLRKNEQKEKDKKQRESAIVRPEGERN